MRDFTENIELANNWVLCTFSDVSEGENAIVDGPFGSNLKTSDYIDDTLNGVPVLTTKNLEGDYSDKKVRFISKAKFEDLKRSQVKPGDILVAKIGSIGKTGIYPKNARVAIIPANLLKFTVSKEVEFNYIYFYLNFFGLQNKIKAIATATAQPAFNVTKFRLLEVPLPPLPEQQRIVAKIEELFSSLDKGIESLKTAQQQLKVYRQAVLEWAFEGKLTEELRKNGRFPSVDELIGNIQKKGKEYGNKLKYPKISDNEKLPPIPDEWVWLRNEELLKYVTSGSRDWKQYYSNSGSIFIRTQDINTNNIDLSDVAYVSLPQKVEGKRSLVEKGDLLMTITGANVGKVAFIEKEIPEAYVSQSVALMKYLDTDLTKYMWYYFQCRNFGQGLINGLVYGVGRPVLSLENMKEVPIALCSKKEQQLIVSEIESRLSVCDKLEEIITHSLKKAEALRQSILKKAFDGKLVPQVPNDEPASKLLERIKAEKEKTASKKRILK